MIFNDDNADKVIVPHLPRWVNVICFYSSIVSTCIIFLSIILHLLNYRKPFQQRLMIRIQLIVPLFALSCYLMLVNQTSVGVKYIIEPIREVYEAFVIYTFFSLLTDMLNGERNIIIMTSGRQPVDHPGIFKYMFPPMDISDPFTFLNIKRGILQYVWLKPIMCFAILLSELVGWYDVNDMSYKSVYLWLTIIYNLSVSTSLYCLAMFWKILWNDLKPFNPIGKFLCVKLIIFASYWQGVLIGILNVFKLLPVNDADGSVIENGSIGVCIQNALLCFELIAFSIGHWYSFSYHPFSISQLPYGRLQLKYAFNDMIGIKDLIHDFELTFYGDYYKDYKSFDSVEALIAHPDSKGRMSRINQGLRYHYDGKQKHWLPNNAPPSSNSNSSNHVRSTSEINAVHPTTNTPLLFANSEYAASVHSTGTSMRAVYASSPKSSHISPPDSPPLIASLTANNQGISISEILNTDEFNYDKELLDEDELYYQKACSIINNYNLDQLEIKKLLHYPIVDELIYGHEYGYKVKKLRQERTLLQRNSLNGSSHSNNSNGLNSNESYRYGSIV
ncbi:organic solute transporter Ostalpha-domain-containing protein [Scheffersomyces coipomensis]|uniref:organic solute transporter Ostalpha-domain-containing protein n=1 Tax=Scheffersomyces coipomensis TaxID=1788519 RepID=UPI00315DC967